MEFSNSYTPIDLSSLKTPPIYSEKDLETEITKICETLKDTQSQDWKKRTDNLKKVQEISLLYLDAVDGNSSISVPYYLNQMLRLFNPLTSQVQHLIVYTVQLLDLRSATAKEAGKTIQIISQCLQNDFEQLAYKFLSKDSILKLLNSGNKILAEIGNNTMIGIINNTYAPKQKQQIKHFCRLPLRFYEEMKTSKNPWVHAKLANILYLILEIYPYEQTFDRTVNILEQYLQQCLTDANPEARQKGRKAFISWQKIHPQAAEALFKILDYQVQRAISEEKDNDTTATTTKSIISTNQSILQTTKTSSFKANKQQIIHQEETRSISQSRSKTVTNQPEVKKIKTPSKQMTKTKFSSPNEQKKSPTKFSKFNESQVQQPQLLQQKYSNPFQQAQSYDNRMEIDQQNYVFSFDRAYQKLKNQNWFTKVEALEELVEHISAIESENLLKLYQKEKTFPLIVKLLFQQLEQETIAKVIEISLEFLDILIRKLPESIFNQIEELIKCLLRLVQNKKDTINVKANEILNLSQEILSPDVLLPNLIGYMVEIATVAEMLSTKICCLEVLNILIKNSQNLSEEVQFESIISVIGTILQLHLTNKGVQMPSLGGLLALRDKHLAFTISYILDLPQVQFNIIKQLANAYERTFAKQLIDAYNDQQEFLQKHQQIEEQKVIAQEQETQQKYQQQINRSQQPSIMEIINEQKPNVFQNQTNNHKPTISIKKEKSPEKQIRMDVQGKENNSIKKGSEKIVQVTTLNQYTPVTVINNYSMSSQSVVDGISLLTNSLSCVIQEIINTYTIIMDPKQSTNNKFNSLKNIQKLYKQYRLQQYEDTWNATYESIIDSIFIILTNPGEPYNLKETCFEVLSDLLTNTPRERLQISSKRIVNMTIREKLLKLLLQIYIQTLPPDQVSPGTSQQCQSNISIDELIEQLLMNCEMNFVAEKVSPLLKQEQPPKLQSLLKAITARTKAINSGSIDKEFKYETYHQIVDAIMRQIDYITEAINNTNADVRKCCVFCLVEFQNIIGDEYFQRFVEKLNPSQQKLVDIYIKRKQDMIKQSASLQNNIQLYGQKA